MSPVGGVEKPVKKRRHLTKKQRQVRGLKALAEDLAKESEKIRNRDYGLSDEEAKAMDADAIKLTKIERKQLKVLKKLGEVGISNSGKPLSLNSLERFFAESRLTIKGSGNEQLDGLLTKFVNKVDTSQPAVYSEVFRMPSRADVTQMVAKLRPSASLRDNPALQERLAASAFELTVKQVQTRRSQDNAQSLLDTIETHKQRVADDQIEAAAGDAPVDDADDDEAARTDGSDMCGRLERLIANPKADAAVGGRLRLPEMKPFDVDEAEVEAVEATSAADQDEDATDDKELDAADLSAGEDATDDDDDAEQQSDVTMSVGEADDDDGSAIEISDDSGDDA